MYEDIDKKIEAYLGGDLNSEEKKQFELIMSDDIELQKKVKLANEINHHLKEENWLSDEDKNSSSRKEIEDYIKSDEATKIRSKILDAGKRYKNPQSKFKSKRLIAAVAAIFVVALLSTVLFIRNSSTTDLYAKYYSDNDLPSLLKRSGQNDFLSKGIKSFKANEYETAITFFKEYLKENDDPILYSYIGISYLEIGNTNKALINFDKLLNSSSIDNSKALWYKSLMYLKINDTIKLRKTLSKIIKDSTNFNYKKAQDLLLAVD
ncbi:hypothetical protein [uncultured Aquimarina sp.]|uniref:tetratricopeptide repeat protein n=1 Tax=uncultured Aquimarina sp. TaxID=575652 RepID=UPI00262D18DF|nr:hypothetical protein [uncultured Aquimarina sp.]